MKMSAHDQTTYPQLKQYVRDSLPKVADIPIIRNAMLEIAQLNHAKLKKALAWGNEPTLKVTKLTGAVGEFSPDVGSNEIRLDTDMVLEFEGGGGLRNAKAGRVYLVGVTILHEMTHWGDDQDGVDRPGEEGEEFETKVYGGVIN
jgi:Metallopeptidase toxin 3